MADMYDRIVNGGKSDTFNSLYRNITGNDYTIVPVQTTTVTPTKKKKKNDWINAGAFEDGYDVGDVTKTILSTGGDLITNATKGLFSIGEGIGDLINYGIAGVSDAMGQKEFAKNLREETKKSITDEIFNPVEEFYDENSAVGEKLDNFTQMAGSIYGNVALAGLGSGAGLGRVGTTALTTGVNGASTMGSSMSNAYNNGATDKEALMYGGISGASSMMVNLLVGGLSKGVNTTGISSGIGRLDDKVAQTLTQRIENQLVKNFAEAGIKAVGEGGESMLQGVIDAYAKKLTYMSDSEIEDLIQDEDLLNKFVTGAVTSGIMQAPGVIRTAVNVDRVPVVKNGQIQYDKSGNIKTKNVYSKKTKEAVRDYITGLTKNEQRVYDKEVENRINELSSSGEKITNKQKNKIRNEVKEDLAKGYIKTDTIEEALGGERYEQLQRFNDNKAKLEKQINRLQKKIGKDTDKISEDFSFEEYNNYSRANLRDRKKLETLQNDLKATEYKINKAKQYLGNEVSELTNNDEFLQESYKEVSRKRNQYQIDPTKEYTERGQAFVQKAMDSGVLNDSRKTHEFVDMLAKISEDKGLDFEFVNNDYLKNSDLSIDGYLKEGKVNINIDSEKSLNTILGHEVTHALEESGRYDDISSMVKDFMGDKEYRKELNKVKTRYKDVKDAVPENELVSDFIGEHLFTDKEFVENLAKNRNTFQKIHDEIKYLKDIATAGSKEKRQLTKIEHTFSDIYSKMPKLENEINSNSAISSQSKNVSETPIKIKNIDNTDDPYEQFGRENGTGLTDDEVAPVNTKYSLANDGEIKYNNANSSNGKLTKYNYDDPDINAILATDKNAKKYLDYTRDSAFLELKEEQRDYLSAKASHTANELYQNPDAKDVITDGEYTAKVRLIDGTDNYEIYDTEPIRESVGDKYGRYRGTSDTILEKYNQRRQGFSDRNSESTGYRGKANTDDGLVSRKLQETRNDETENNVGKGTRDSKELDNSSFSLQQKYDDISTERKKLQNELASLNQQRKEIQEKIPNYNMFKKYDELEDIDKLINENTEKSKNLSFEQDEIQKQLDEIVAPKQKLESESYSLDSLPKLKKGYVRLYRGLNEEYNPNYDRSKLDSPNGYDTLTDNYDLAKQYGKNVYFIDVPKEQVANEIMDNNGVRNFAYKDDKPAGLNGVSGDEYLLNTQHGNFNANNYHKIETTNKIGNNTKYSVSKSLTQDDTINNYISKHNYKFKENGVLEVSDLTDKQINDLVKLYKTTGYDDVSTDWLKNRLKKGNMPVQREVADRFIEKELGYKPKYDTTKIFEDADGNKLTKEQVEFYKDSDVRDIRGRLIPVYHKTNAEFTEFDKSAGKQHGNKYGKGFYFSITPENYGNNTIKAYLNAKSDEVKYIPSKGYYIVQEPNQIKYVDNLNPTDNPDIRYSKGNDDIAPIGNYNVYGKDVKIEEDIAPTKNGLGYIPKDPTREESYDFKPTKDTGDKVLNSELDRIEKRVNDRETAKKNNQMMVSTEKTPWRRAKDKFKRLFINSNVELDNLANESGNKNIKFKADMLNNVYAEAQSNITNAQTDNQGNAIGKSINQLFEPAKESGLENAFNDYLIHYSNIDRHEHGIGSSVPMSVSQQLVHDYEKAYPEFKQWGKDVWNYGKNAKNNLADAGIITKELSNKLEEMYPHYVPYIVDKKDLSNYIDDLGEIMPKKVIKRGKGNASSVLPVEQALTKYTYAQKNSVRQNELYSEIVNTFYDEKNPLNITLDDTDPSNIKGNLYQDEKGNYLTAFVDGKEKSVRISKDLYSTLNRDMENYIKDLESDFGAVTKPLQKISKWRRNILTKYSPTFPIKNAIKDLQDASFNSKYTKDFAKNYLTSFSELKDDNNEMANQFKSLYGSGNLMGEYNVDSGLYDGNIKETGKLNKLAKINDIVELAPRYAEFKASIQNGASFEEAMYNAREVTTNFSRGGVITKAMNRNGFTFLNASVQGLDKFVRNFSGENGARGIASSVAKATAFGVAPAIFNDLMFGSGDDKDKDYEALPNYIKDNYYLIKTEGNNFIRIPKGRSLSVFGSAGRRALEYMNGDKEAFEGYLDNVNSQIGVGNPEENNIFAPIQQAYGSENGTAWYGGDLVPTRLQKKPKAEQYDETTDEFSKWLGEKLDASPYKINYLIDQYSGGIGDIILPTITKEASSDNDSVVGTMIAPIKDQFVVDSTSDNKYVGKFYDTSDELTIKANSEYATDDDLLKKKYIGSITSELNKLYAERREIQNDETLSRSERYKKSQVIKDEINKLAKEGLDTYSAIDRTDSYAVIGDREYYKNAKDEWTKVEEKELDSLRSLGLTTKEKSSYYTSKNSISNIEEYYKDILKNTSEENKNIVNNKKKKEIVNAIRNTNLTNDAKAYLYDKNYGDTETLNALTILGFNIDNYMDFDSQLFESDKYTNGKTVPNSKRNKIFKYINQMNIPFEQKIILAKLKYSSYNDYNYEIIQYLNNSDLDYGTQVKLLKKMGFTVYDDGRVTWK